MMMQKTFGFLPLLFALQVFEIASWGAAQTVPSCVPSNQLSSADIRSTNNRGLLLNVYNGTLVGTPPASSSVTVVSQTGTISVASVEFITSQTPNVIIVVFSQIPNYIGYIDPTTSLYSNNSVSITIPSSFFTQGVSCGTITFNVSVSPGTIDNSGIPTTTTEIDINTGDTIFIITVMYDEFLSAAVSTASPLLPGLELNGTLIGGSQSNQLQIFVPKNISYLLPYQSSEVVTFVFSAENMRTGLAPNTEVGGFPSPITWTISYALPFVSVNYTSSAGALTAQDCWDGTAAVTLALYGDVWITNVSLWTDPATAPTFTAGSPIQPYAWQYFLDLQILPTVTVTSHVVYLAFPAMHGFTLSNEPTTALVVSGFNALASEHTNMASVSISVVAAPPSAVIVTWGGPAFTQNITEVDVRVNGLLFWVSMTYNIFSEPPDDTNLVGVIFQTTTGQFSEGGLMANITNLTQLTLYFPPQPSYVIYENDVFNVTIPADITETDTTPTNSDSSFTVLNFKGASTCRLTSPIALTESVIRDTAGLNISLSIVTGTDQFCYSTTAMAALMSSLSFSESGPNQVVSLTPTIESGTSIVFSIAQNPTFQINQVNFLSLVIPSQLMCSLQPCLANPEVQASEPTLVELPILITPGTLYADFPNITEIDMQTTDYNILLHLVGDSFFETSSTSTFSFQPSFSVVPTGTTGRGFTTSIAPNVIAVTLLGNASYATLTIPHNASFDTSVTESITIQIAASLTASGQEPTVAAAPMIIQVVTGILTSSIPTTGTTITEREFIDGGFTFTATLSYDLFVPSVVPTVLRSSLATDAPLTATGVQATVSSWLPDAAFSLNFLEDVLQVTFQPNPSFNTLTVVTFNLSFTSACFASGRLPQNSSYSFTIYPSPGTMAISGTATFAGSISVVKGGLNYILTLTNDLWVPFPQFTPSDFCVITPTCSIVLLPGSDQRNVSVTFDSNPSFIILSNTTYTVSLRPSYFVSGQVPSGTLQLFVYITSGIVTWAFQTAVSTVTESMVMLGQTPTIIAAVEGDLFAPLSDVRSSLISHASCVGSTNGPYGFCALASALFATIAFDISASSTLLHCTLQGNALFDIYEPQTVTLYLGALAFQSGLAPSRSDNLTFTIQPTRGSYYVSGSLSGITAATLQTPALARQVQLIITLYGDRWLSNASLALAALLPGIVATGVGSSQLEAPFGWSTYASEILNPVTSPSEDATGQVLTLVFNAVPSFSISLPQTISVTVPAAAVLSGLAPTAGSGTVSTFTIAVAPGTISLAPTVVSQEAMETTGVNVTVTISGASWQPTVMLNVPIGNYITSSATPIEEPNGFAANRAVILSTVSASGVSELTLHSFVLNLQPVASFALIYPESLILTPTTALTVSNQSFTPSFLTVRFDPTYPFVEAIVAQASNDFDSAAWQAAVAASLEVSPGDIIIYTVSQATQTSNPSAYTAVVFRVVYDGPLSTTSNPIPFDNIAARTFLSFNTSYAQATFNVSLAFYNTTPPSPAVILSIGSASQVPSSPSVPLDTTYMLAISGAVAAVLLGAYGYRRFYAGKYRTSLRWSVTGRKGAADATQGASLEKDGVLQRAADVLYAGQSGLLPQVTVVSTTPHPESETAAVRTVVSQMAAVDPSDERNTFTPTGDVGARRPLARVLYSGQASRDLPESMPMSYVERLERNVLKRPTQRQWPIAPQPHLGEATHDTAAASSRLSELGPTLPSNDGAQSAVNMTHSADSNGALSFSAISIRPPGRSRFRVSDHNDYYTSL